MVHKLPRAANLLVGPVICDEPLTVCTSRRPLSQCYCCGVLESFSGELSSHPLLLLFRLPFFVLRHSTKQTLTTTNGTNCHTSTSLRSSQQGWMIIFVSPKRYQCISFSCFEDRNRRFLGRFCDRIKICIGINLRIVLQYITTDWK